MDGGRSQKYEVVNRLDNYLEAAGVRDDPGRTPGLPAQATGELRGKPRTAEMWEGRQWGLWAHLAQGACEPSARAVGSVGLDSGKGLRIRGPVFDDGCTLSLAGWLRNRGRGEKGQAGGWLLLSLGPHVACLALEQGCPSLLSSPLLILHFLSGPRLAASF